MFRVNLLRCFCETDAVLAEIVDAVVATEKGVSNNPDGA